VIKLMMVLLLLASCSPIEDRRRDANILRPKIEMLCACKGGYSHISYYMNWKLFDDGYSGAEFTCFDSEKKYSVRLGDEVRKSECKQ